jgi:hypothetical protein
MMVRALPWALALAALAVRADLVGIPALRDATIYSDTTGSGELANGAGQYLFAGRTGDNDSQQIRRALLFFDLAAIPAGSVVTSASVRLSVSRAPPGAGSTEVTLHRALRSWGEGSSDPLGSEGTGTAAGTDDATWLYAFHPGALWSAQGGDFSGTASASATAGDFGEVLFAAGLVGDVQSWLQAPAANYGWFLLGDEAGVQNARRFNSRNLGDEDTVPLLTVGYLVPEPGAGGLLLLAAAFLLSRPRFSRYP